MSFYFFLDQGNVINPVMVQYEFSFVVDQVWTNNQKLLGRAKGNHKFCSRDAYRLLCLKEREIFEKSNYLKNDSFTVRCDIIIYKHVNINEAVGGTILVSDVLPSPDISQPDLLSSRHSSLAP
jgi:speckle-type POZ protein